MAAISDRSPSLGIVRVWSEVYELINMPITKGKFDKARFLVGPQTWLGPYCKDPYSKRISFGIVT